MYNSWTKQASKVAQFCAKLFINISWGMYTYIHVNMYIHTYVHVDKCIKRRRVWDVSSYTRICNNMGMYASRPLTHSPTHTHIRVYTYVYLRDCMFVCPDAMIMNALSERLICSALNFSVECINSATSYTHKHTRTPTQQRQRRLRCCCGCGCCSCACKNRTFCVRLWL